MAANADSIPRYEIPDYVYGDDSAREEGIACADCAHCFQVSDAECTRVIGRMSPYGHWRKCEREVNSHVRHALKCFGVCEVECGLVDLSDEVCEHFQEVE